MHRLGLSVLLLTLLAACDDANSGAEALDASGAASDARPLDMGLDAGPALDASLADATPVDAAPMDQGLQPDALLDSGPPDPAQRVLFLGNSYTASNNLPRLVQRVLMSVEVSIEVQAITPGGRRLTQHATDLQTPGSPVADAFEAGPWHHIVLQEQSQIPGFPGGSQDLVESLQAAAVLGAAAEGLGAGVVFYQTWGRRDGDDGNPGLYPDFSTMQDRLTAGYLALAAQAEGAGASVEIAPVGEAFRLVLAEEGVEAFEALYVNDGSHPSLQGSWLAALVLAARLADIDPMTVSFAPDDLSELEVSRLKRAAAMAIESP